jgi:hypothetical protein
MTHQHRGRPFAFLRTKNGEDRRRYTRFDQIGLMARIGNKLVKVHDLSVGGLQVEPIDVAAGSTIALTMLPSHGGRVDLNRSQPARGEVVGHGGGHTHIRFTHVSYTLAKFIVQHLARRTGVEPYIFR